MEGQLKAWPRYLLTVVLGIAAGASTAVYRVRCGLSAGQIFIGPWATAKTYGTTDADALTRARVARSGLLALPAHEAMYFTAKTDSAGRPFDGKCRYRLTGGTLPARWWSVTLYQDEGWLVKNAANRWSVGSAAFAGDAAKAWTIAVAPDAQPGQWIPTAGVPAFDLTLRTYHPSLELLAHPESAKLPFVERLGCK